MLRVEWEISRWYSKLTCQKLFIKLEFINLINGNSALACSQMSETDIHFPPTGACSTTQGMHILHFYFVLSKRNTEAVRVTDREVCFTCSCFYLEIKPVMQRKFVQIKNYISGALKKHFWKTLNEVIPFNKNTFFNLFSQKDNTMPERDAINSS